ncbi:MAG: arginine repressor [Peptoniphilaceae bacterium]|nr:arginine repressor [Peptoniphilaceae bacterium]MCI6659304.1 arginine repressor [Peptoniphilaceae bacterium]MDD7434754.1 arginine repressor [Peptoniphilaceae bacterium]MDD7543058.1 arginine repressor [Peptoniphilaceae bacterium]MDY3075767.1 arginine repressor [Peptoniphilaceae bacterium]
MKKYNRQRLILDLIEQETIQTQDELSELLDRHGIHATQATISRDIKELRISKVQTTSGEYKYTVLDTAHDSLNERLHKILRSSVLSIAHNGDLVIVQTVSYCAAVCSVAITNAKFNHVAGIVSGYDTLFVAPSDKKYLEQLVKDIKEFIQ